MKKILQNAEIDHFSEFALFKDELAPLIKEIYPKNGINININDVKEKFSFKVMDKGSGINYRRIEMYLDDKWRISEYDYEKNEVFSVIDDKILAGDHILRLEVADYMGNFSSKEIKFTIIK